MWLNFTFIKLTRNIASIGEGASKYLVCNKKCICREPIFLWLINLTSTQRFTRTYTDFVTSIFMQLQFRDINLFFFYLTSSQCKIVQDSLNWILYSTLSPEVRLSKGPETFRVQNLLNKNTVPRLEKLSGLLKNEAPGFRIPETGFQIQIVSGIPDSLKWIPKITYSTSKNFPDRLTLGDNLLNMIFSQLFLKAGFH